MKVVKINFRKIKKLNDKGKCYKNFSLRYLTTFKIGGNAKYYLNINTIENFIKVMDYLNEKQVPYFIIGNGSNLLVSDKGYNGVVIKFGGDFDRIENFENILECGTAVMLGGVLSKCRKLSLSGLEDSVGIPATIGGATFMNASAYNFEMAKIIESVVAYVDGKLTYFSNEDCQFGYRKSVFQTNNAIILRVRLRLDYGDKKLIDERCREIMFKRKSSQPLEYPSAGSIFKRREDMVVSASLDECGVKGMMIGGAEVSNKHANFIINKDSATSQDVIKLINLIKQKFENTYNKKLDCEIRLLGEFDETIG